MAILNNNTVTIDAVLTAKGRELMARNDGSFQITQFSLADDEVDYTLYNPQNPSGSAFYGQAIEAMPVIEAFPDDTQIMIYKLVTLPRGTAKLPVINVGTTVVSMPQGGTFTITPQTLNYLGATSTIESNGYAVTVSDVRLLSVFSSTGVAGAEVTPTGVTQTLGSQVSQTLIGTNFSLTGTTINTLFGSNSNQITATITVLGRDSGARITVPLVITKTNS
jgi:hypothetical protein